MREEREFDEALERIAAGAALRNCGVPKSTVLNRADRDGRFARRLAAAQQTGRLRHGAQTHVVDGGRLTREELVAIITAQAREGRGWACRLMLELLDSGEGVSNAEQQSYLDRMLALVES